MKLSRMVQNGTAKVNGSTLEHVDFNFSGTVEIDMDVKHIGNSAFNDCKHVTEIKIPEGVETIQAGAFMGCSSLKEIEIPNSVEKIGDHAFYGCSHLQEVSVPQTTNMGNHIFDKCENLAVVNYMSETGPSIGVGNSEKMIEHGYINANLSDLVAEGKAVVTNGCLDRVDPSFKGGINIDMDIQQISSMALCDCKGVTEINIPDSVQVIGSGAFMGCTSLQEIHIPNSVEHVGDYAMYGCTGLQEVSMPQAAHLGEHLFDGDATPSRGVTYTSENGVSIGVASSERGEVSLDEYVDRNGRDSNNSKDDVNDNTNDNANDDAFDL